MILVDANYILRWFLNDIPTQAEIANDLFESSLPESLQIDRLSVAEVTYVLRVKNYSHKQIAQLFYEIYTYPSVAEASNTFKVALDLYRDTTLDYEDCWLLASAKINSITVATFDKKLLKQLGQ